MEHEEVGNMKIVLHYETSGRLGRNNYDLSIAVSGNPAIQAEQPHQQQQNNRARQRQFRTELIQ